MNLQERYDRDAYLEFLRTFVPGFKQDIRTVVADKLAVTQEAHFLGESEELDLSVFELTHTSSTDARVSLSMDGFKLMKTSATYRALIVYRSENSEDWRFSLMTATPDLDEKGKIVRKLSNPRRFSFFLGPNAKINTPNRFLIKEGPVRDFADLQSRFSLEVVNKEFYKQIANLFVRLTGGKLKLGSHTETFDTILELPYIRKPNPETQDSFLPFQEFAVRLIGRCIFCWFLKQKKTPSGQSLLPESLLSVQAITDTPEYYHLKLEKLFFEVLNKQKEQRPPDVPDDSDAVPFLNGGLFDPHREDFYENGKWNGALKIPDEWLHDFFDLLETYNFTIDENTPVDTELSVDPEMLGRIFENLLAEINPETGESARKHTGSYYTPREIVEYMVDESLKLYLKEKTDINDERLSSLLSYGEEDDGLSESEKQKVINALEKLKIIDPACGSGAFPLGILHKMVLVLQKVDPEAQQWLRSLLESVPDQTARDVMRRKLEDDKDLWDYTRKLGVIRRSIYGVDIQPIGVEITKLRCFLSLVVDEKINDRKKNRGIEPLPNLEFKFVCANSLMPLPASPATQQQQLFEDDSQIAQLKILRDRYFVSNGKGKIIIENQFRELQQAMFEKVLQGWREAQEENSRIAKLAEWKPFSNERVGWFDSEWMFGVKGGFDIVISNPPYIRIQILNKKDKEQAQFLKKHYRSAEKGNYDMYVVFVERGLELLNKNGFLSYILPHKFFTAQYGEPLRGIISEQNYLAHVVHFGDQQIFEGATTYTCLLFLGNKDNDKFLFSEVPNINEWFDNRMSNNAEFSNAKLAAKPWNFVLGSHSDIFSRLSNISTTLGGIADIFQGIVTSADPIYILEIRHDLKGKYSVYSSHLNEAFEIEKDRVRPFIKDVTIVPYEEVKSSHGLVFPYAENGIIPWNTIVSDLPLTAKYLSKCKDILSSRESGKMKNEKWYGYVYPKNLLKFQESKLIVQVISKFSRYSIDRNGKYFTGGGNGPYYGVCVKEESKDVTLEYLAAILNSKVADFYLKKISSPFRGGYWSYGKQYIERIPIELASKKSISEIEKLVKRVLKNKEEGKDSTELENEINQHVYEVYRLNNAEKKLIESLTK